MFGQKYMQENKIEKSNTNINNHSSYINLSSIFDPNHGLSYITFKLSSFHFNYPFSMANDNDAMDMSDDTNDVTKSKAKCPVIDNMSGSPLKHGTTKAKEQENEKNVIKLFLTVSLYLSKAWQCNVLVNDRMTRHFFYSGKPLITYAFIIQYQFKYLQSITDTTDIWGAMTGIKEFRIAREKRNIDSARSFEMSQSYKKIRNAKLTLDKSKIESKSSNLLLTTFNDCWKNLTKSSMSSEACSSKAGSISEMSSSSSTVCTFDDSAEDMYSNIMDLDGCGNLKDFDFVNGKKSKFSIGTVIDKFKTKKHKLTDKFKKCVSNVKGRVGNRLRRRKIVD